MSTTPRTIRIGIVGLGKNTRLRHVPGFQACEAVEIVAVCNRRSESTQAAAREFNIRKTYDDWRGLVKDEDVDAVIIGTWPYLHCPITLAALDHGKHVLTEARMASNVTEARQMLEAARRHPQLVTQIVPSPFGLRAGQVAAEMLDDGFIGELREFVVLGMNADFADPEAPLHWRQSAEFSGVNMLALGILHETLIRWLPDPVSVLATTKSHVESRRDSETDELKSVDRPDSVHVSTQLASGARGVYVLSGAVHHGPGFEIQLYGTEGTLRYQLAPDDRLLAGRKDQAMREIPVPSNREGTWRVEADFVAAMRGAGRPKLTDFATGARYMEFTEAVERSARIGAAVSLPLD